MRPILASLMLVCAFLLEAQAWTMSSAPTLRIGSDTTPEYQFSRIDHLDRLSDGRIVVTMGPDIRFYDAAGKYLSKAGGRGGGPGEFQYITSLMVMPGDTLLTMNVRTVVVLDPQGKFVRQVPVDFAPLAAAGWYSEERFLLPNGNILAPQYLRVGMNTPNPTLHRPVLRYSILDVAAGRVVLLHTSGGIAQKSVNGQSYTMPFSPHAQHAIGSDRVYVGDNDSTRIHAFTLDGRPVGSITVAERAIPVSAADMKAQEEQMLERVGQNGLTKERVDQHLANMPRPTRHPFWGTAFVDATGALWVSGPARPKIPLAWTTYDRAGKRIGSITMPLGFTPKEAAAGYVLGVQRDADGVETIAMYSLRRTR